MLQIFCSYTQRYTWSKWNVLIFSLQDAICSGLFAISLFAGAVSNAAYSSDNADTYDNNMCDNGSQEGAAEDACNDLATVRDAEGATAVSFSVMCDVPNVWLYWETVYCNISCHASFIWFLKLPSVNITIFNGIFLISNYVVFYQLMFRNSLNYILSGK